MEGDRFTCLKHIHPVHTSHRILAIVDNWQWLFFKQVGYKHIFFETKPNWCLPIGLAAVAQCLGENRCAKYDWVKYPPKIESLAAALSLCWIASASCKNTCRLLSTREGWRVCAIHVELLGAPLPWWSCSCCTFMFLPVNWRLGSEKSRNSVPVDWVFLEVQLPSDTDLTANTSGFSRLLFSYRPINVYGIYIPWWAHENMQSSAGLGDISRKNDSTVGVKSMAMYKETEGVSEEIKSKGQIWWSSCYASLVNGSRKRIERWRIGQ